MKTVSLSTVEQWLYRNSQPTQPRWLKLKENAYVRSLHDDILTKRGLHRQKSSTNCSPVASARFQCCEVLIRGPQMLFPIELAGHENEYFRNKSSHYCVSMSRNRALQTTSSPLHNAARLQIIIITVNNTMSKMQRGDQRIERNSCRR